MKMFKVGDKIVYPMHGAGTIESIEEREILGEKQKYYIMKMPVGDIKVMVPTKNAELIGVIPEDDCVTTQSLEGNFFESNSKIQKS